MLQLLPLVLSVGSGSSSSSSGGGFAVLGAAAVASFTDSTTLGTCSFDLELF